MKGFTLIEILVVMVIISIVSGVVLMTMNTNQKKEAELVAKKLVNLINLAEQEAIFQQATLGLNIKQKSFQFYYYDVLKANAKEPWQYLSDKRFQLHHLPKNFKMALKINGKPVKLGEQPQIIITASGEVTPFVISFKKGNNHLYRVVGDTNGNIKLD